MPGAELREESALDKELAAGRAPPKQVCGTFGNQLESKGVGQPAGSKGVASQNNLAAQGKDGTSVPLHLTLPAACLLRTSAACICSFGWIGVRCGVGTASTSAEQPSLLLGVGY